MPNHYPPRPCPANFEQVLIAHGRDGAEHVFRAGRPRINKWLDECGKARLIAARAAYVAERRKAKREARR